MKSKGYSLIEILVVLSILGILFEVGYTGFRDFSRRQSIADSVNTIQGDLRLAQEMALSGKLSADANCTSYTLNGYLFNILTSTSYEIRAKCSGPGSVSPVKTVTIPAGETITPVSTSILFKVLGQGTNIPSGQVVITVTQTATSNTASVTVDSGGQIQ